jgi:hypothetical protein
MNKLTLTERYNVRKVAYLYANIDKFGPLVYAKCKNKQDLAVEISKLKAFLEHVTHHNGVINVSYKTDKDGRIFGSPHTIQNISGVVRNFLLEDEDIVDVDIVNSISCILLSLCNKHNLKCPTLQKYYDERQTIIDKYYGGDKDLCKDFINPSFFKKYEKIQTSNKFEEKMKDDIITIHDFAHEHKDFAKYRKQAIKTCKRDNKDNVKGRTLNYLYTDIECDILKQAMEHYQTKTKKEIRTAMFDGFLAEKSKTFKLSNLNRLMGKIIDSDIKFIYKPITQNVIPDIPKSFKFDIDDIKTEYRKNKIIKRELPELQHKPDVVGECKYLSDIFTYEMYQNNDTIVLQSCCGTGKTYSVAKYIAQSNDKVISIINRKSLLTAQIKEFNDKGLDLSNYENKETYDLNENGIICINSIMKYSRQSNDQFKDFVVYVDEINSFLETLSHSAILTKDVKLVYETLMRIIQNCKKLIVSDHTITDAALMMFKSKKSKRTIYIKNKYRKFKGVHALQVKNEARFKDKIQEAMKANKGFFAGFDSATSATLYFNSLKDFTTLDCILVTDETRVKIPNNMSEWEGKCIFYSPKIETGVDFSIDTKQQVFYHMKGNSVLPTSSFQMICRTRNMDKLTWYAEPTKETDFKYKSLIDTQEKATEHKEKTNVYMCSSYLDENDDLQYAPNSFYNIWTYNEYVKDIYENNKAGHLNDLLMNNVFECTEDLYEAPEKLDKNVINQMNGMTEEAIEETFTQWINKEAEVEMFETRSSMLNLTTDDDKTKYKELITDRTTFEEHLKLKLLLKEKSFIESKASSAVENSYVEFGLNNIYSKIKLLAEFEQQTNITRFDTSNVAVGAIDDKTWTMIKKLYSKTTKKPETIAAIEKEYSAMVNSIVKNLYDGKRVGERKLNKRVYDLNVDKIQTSFELDYVTMSHSNPLKNYDRTVMNHIGLQFPEFEVDEFENVIFGE